MTHRPTLNAGALRDAPALIESVFPAQKVSFEAQKERKAQASQTLTALGSFWKGRKPLILVRAVVLGALLPATDDAERDLDVFERLMAFDEESLARRALANNAFNVETLQELIPINEPERYLTASGWRRDIGLAEKLELYRPAIATFGSYEEKAALCKRPEEVDADWLYEPVWPVVNRHYAHLGIQANSFDQLIEQLGTLRYGRRPRVGDTFSGGGSIPFEAARLGCDVYASDLNPLACMLTWGTFNIIGATPEQQRRIKRAQQAVAEAVEREIKAQGIEHDAEGNRIKALLHCLETRCPETGWMVPMSTTWVVSKIRSTIARLEPDHAHKRFHIRIVSGVTPEELAAASEGTIQSSHLVYELDGQTYRTPVKTLRGDYRLADGTTGNRLRPWERSDFKPRADDILQERLFAIQWVTHDTVDAGRQETYFAEPTAADLERERKVEEIVGANLDRWQREGFVPDMAIEPGDETTRLMRERGWTHWQHLYMPRQLYYAALVAEAVKAQPNEIAAALQFDRMFLADKSAKLSQWRLGSPGRPGRAPSADGVEHVFYNQALNVFYNYGVRGFQQIRPGESVKYRYSMVPGRAQVETHEASQVAASADLWITDPPYADAVNYHEITEFFIAWLRRNPPAPFDNWVWDSRRALAIQGSGEDFRRNMVATYTAMVTQMPDNGMQCVMFTHQDTGVWSDLVGIFWAAGLQVVAAWYIATETTSELKKGGYVQGTVTLMLRKRPAGDRPAFKQRLLPAVRQEVDRQIRTMMHLNTAVKAHHGEPVFNDSDLQMAGYAAALKVLTGYTHIGGEDVTSFALRPRVKGEVTVVDEIVQQAAEAASNLLVPEGLSADTWGKLSGIERFVLRMMDMETTGARKLDNYQNFAKAFRVQDYARVMASMAPNEARLKQVTEFASRDLTDSTELGATRLGRLVIALQQMRADLEPQTIISQLQAEMPDFLEARPLLVDLLAFVERKAPEADVRTAAEVLGARLKNQRFGV
jgi:adenine-specific DNA methylase